MIVVGQLRERERERLAAPAKFSKIERERERETVADKTNHDHRFYKHGWIYSIPTYMSLHLTPILQIYKYLPFMSPKFQMNSYIIAFKILEYICYVYLYIFTNLVKLTHH